MRRLIGVLVGLLVFVAVVGAAEAITAKIVPPPAGFNPSDPSAVRALAAAMPARAWFLIAAGWLVASFAAGFVAAKISRSLRIAVGLGIGGTLFAVLTNIQVPPPPWFWVLSFALFVPPAWFAGRLATAQS